MFEIHATTRHFALVPGAPPLNEESHLNVRNGRGVQTLRVMEGDRVIENSVEPVNWTQNSRTAKTPTKTPKNRKATKNRKVRKTRKVRKVIKGRK